MPFQHIDEPATLDGILAAACPDTVAFGSTVTFRRDDGRVQQYQIVGENEVDSKAGAACRHGGVS
jgi:transcription elongation GreA/GreB family factor